MMIAAQDYSQHSLPSSEPPSPSMSRSRLHTQSGQQPVIPQLQKIVKENPLCLDMIQKNLSNLQWSADDDQMVFTSLSLPVRLYVKYLYMF